MSKLEELIKEFCPNGVEYKKLTDIASVLYGYPCDAALFNESGKGRPLARIRDVLAGRTNTYSTENVPEKYILSKGDLLVGMDGNFHTAIWQVDNAIICQRVCKIYSKDENILLNGFLFHLLRPLMRQIENNKQSGTVKHLLDKDIKAIVIPLPALPVQREIVRILDSFTLYSAELTARRKQYEFYRDKLLNFDIEIEWKTIEEACNMSAGGDVPKDRFSREKTEQFYVPVYSNGVDENALYGYTDKAKIFEPCITVAARGTIGYCALRTEPFFPVVRLICLCPKKEIIPKYLKYYIETIHFQVPTSGIPQLTVPMIGKYKIPVPPIDVQERIVKVLDNFDAICSDLGIGLPAEIEKR